MEAIRAQQAQQRLRRPLGADAEGEEVEMKSAFCKMAVPTIVMGVAGHCDWVNQEREAEIRKALACTLKVRQPGREMQELANRHFFEILRRVHLAAEGVPYTGLKTEPVEPPVCVTTDTHPGRKYAGQISVISCEAEFTPKNVQTESSASSSLTGSRSTFKTPTLTSAEERHAGHTGRRPQQTIR